MKKQTKDRNRRNFIKKCGLSTVPFLIPSIDLGTAQILEDQNLKPTVNKAPVNFIYDGLALSPQGYLEKLNEIQKRNPIEQDFYGYGGATKLLEDKFAELTGKEKAIYLPTGTMANQLAIKLLNGNKTKVIVPENSHVFRDEADAAQSVHQLRLVPIGKDKSFFELEDLKQAIDYVDKNEVFKSGLGTIVIENPVRRANGTAVPIETIKEISNYCKQQGYKMHLDGARIHLASAFTKVSLIEYASCFDTVYISLYKYLNTTGGAILCGEAKLIDQISHQIKILGGATYQSWFNTSVALHYLDGISDRLNQVVSTTEKLIVELNKIDGLHIHSIKNGTNIYQLKLDSQIDSKKIAEFLFKEHQISLRINEDETIRFAVNESLLQRDYQEIVSAWIAAVAYAHN